MAEFEAGQIVIVNSGDALPKQANKQVVEDAELFSEVYPNVILVPLTEDAGMVVAELSVRIDPTPENGGAKSCYAVSPLVAGTSKLRVRPTRSRITQEQLARIRRQVATAIGVE